MNNSLPYKVLYSIGNQCCKKCAKPIQPNRLQMAIMIQSDDDDCHFPEWYHMKCFFKTCLPRTEAAFDGFANLRYVDQLAIKVHLGTMEIEPDIERKTPKLPDFGIEYAREEHDSCTACQQKIKKDEIRIMNVVYDLSRNTAYDGRAQWYHVICFVGARSDLGWLQSGESLPGFKRLSEEDKEVVKSQIPLISRELYKPTESRTNPNQEDLEKLIEVQNKEYYELYDNLAKYVSDEDRTIILRANIQMIPNSRIELLHHLTDVIYFGALNPCESCGTGELVFVNSTYVCEHISAWSKCSNEVKEPQRRSTIIADHLLAKYPFLKTNQPVRTRVLHSFRLTDENGQDLVYAPYKHPPLFNMEFALVGKLRMPQLEIERKIRKMGGKVVSIIHDKLAAVISNQREVEKMAFQMIQAKKYNIQVISEDFLAEVTTTDPILYIISKSLADWGGDPYARIEQSNVVSRRDAEFYTKSLPDKMTYKWKDGCAVDPECGLESNAHVYSQLINGRRVPFSVILGFCDIENNKNSYYRIQLLESNELKLYWVFESWGRISTVIGSKRLTNYGRLSDATEKFKVLYKEKTGNNFGNIRFIKRTGHYYHLDIEFGPSKQTLDTMIPTKLSLPVYQLMQMLFDLKQIESMMVSCDLDLKQMPLGKISANQIRSAMTVLKEISRLISRNGTFAKLREASNKFYTLIPHCFGINRPTVIDSIQIVNEKNELLESLLNMELIYEFLDGKNDKCNPLDSCYSKLAADIEPLDKYSAVYLELHNIIQNTHGATHNQYTLEILEAFKVRREGEDNRFQAYDSLANHQLLWHGSRLTNFVSILSSGLKIAPPEAPPTGYMFGKGIYFADVVSKAANYCITNRTNNIGLMLLCEVALGQTQDLYFANNNITGLPNQQHQSVRACGATFPMRYSMVDGVYVAAGNLCRAQFPTALHYNEYVVYDPAQVRIKYLVKMKFNYR